MSTMAVSDPSAAIRPIQRIDRLPVTLPNAVSAGPAITGHQSGGLLFIASTMSGRRSASHSVNDGSNTYPDGCGVVVREHDQGAADAGSPVSATTLYAVLGRMVVRRQASAVPVMSSTMPAAAAAPPIAPQIRCPRRLATAEITPTVLNNPIGYAYELYARTASTFARQPWLSRRSRIR